MLRRKFVHGICSSGSMVRGVVSEFGRNRFQVAGDIYLVGRV